MTSCARDITDIMAEMVRYSEGNLHDIRHFLTVYDYACRIAAEENTDAQTRYKLEISALVHDISCPLCRERYGNTDGHLQEEESGALLEDFLDSFDLPQDVTDSIIFNVCHHHSPGSADTEDFRILIEADGIANAVEKKLPPEAVEELERTAFSTASGKKLLASATGRGGKESLPLEIERKWLINREDIPYSLDRLESHKIEQFYISGSPTIRARSVDGEKFILTVKAKNGSELSRIENETPLSREEYERLKPLIRGSVIKKTRYLHPLDGGLVEEIDIFEDNLEGLAFLEIEFPDAAAAESWETPGWTVRDVSLEPEYKNGALAISGRAPGK